MTRPSPIAIIDCQTAGIAGDMLLGALLDLGADATKITHAIKSIETTTSVYSNINVDIKPVTSKNFCATKVSITASERKHKRNGKQLIETVEKTVKNLKISSQAKQYASNVIHTLIDTESNLHGTSLCNVHLHEIGLVDTAAEIIGTAVALDDLDFFNTKIYVTPVSVGGGLFKFSHGITSSPSPATLAIFQSKNFPIKGGPVESELATPTGAALLVNLTSEVTHFYPEMVPVKVGYGVGDKEFLEVPNILRITLGKSLGASLDSDTVAVLETSVDDVSGEVVGYTVDRLFLEGAKDVSIVPVFAKKSRPAQIIKVIADKADCQRLVNVLIEETGTLGVRVYCCERYLVSRSIFSVAVCIAGEKESVRVKVSKNGQGKIVRLKPEFDDLKRLAEKTSLSLRELSDLVVAEARAVL
ncbi:MAG: nickel pincer cofactor biosynthesis protein LarC [Candidatus Bathyarchaeota archaeon]|nr:nickel pincer cofactor biosynthesis protein LarC [Candidatus Termiticorpusculum sp.]